MTWADLTEADLTWGRFDLLPKGLLRSSSSSSGIEQESLPTVSSSVNLHVSGTHRCSPLVYIHLKRSLFLQLKLYTWGPCLATGGANHKVSPKLLDGSCGNCAGWWEVPVSDCSLEEGIPVRFVVGSFLEKAMLASCPAVVMPNI